MNCNINRTGRCNKQKCPVLDFVLSKIKTEGSVHSKKYRAQMKEIIEKINYATILEIIEKDKRSIVYCKEIKKTFILFSGSKTGEYK